MIRVNQRKVRILNRANRRLVLNAEHLVVVVRFRAEVVARDAVDHGVGFGRRILCARMGRAGRGFDRLCADDLVLIDLERFTDDGVVVSCSQVDRCL